MLTLSPNETILAQLKDGSVILTSQRICHQYHFLGSYHNQNIPLEDITSCETYRNSQLWLLLLEIGALIAGAVLSFVIGPFMLGVGILTGLLFYGLYRITQKDYVIVRSPNNTIAIKVTGINKERVLKFIGLLEQVTEKSVLPLSAHQAAG